MRRAPLLAPAIAALLAIVAEQNGWAALPLAVALACLAAIVAQRTGTFTATAGAVSLALIAGVLISSLRGHPPVITAERATARYAATVVGDVHESETGTMSSALAIDGIGTVRATLRERVVAGERVVVRGRLEPFDEPRNPGEPSMREIERDQGFVARLASARLLAHASPNVWDARAWAARLRAVASTRIRSVVPEPSATILAGALWGERGTLPDDLHDAFQATGTVHVLVTAGLHLGIVAGLVAFGLSFCGLHRTASCAIAMCAIVAYVWFSGAHLPSERAAAMIGVALLARACGARITSWNALAVAALVVAFLWPASVGGASFALSFSCVAAIVLFAEPIAHVLARVPMPEKIREALALTVATQIGTWPLTAAVFSTLAPYATLANAIVVPLMAAIIPSGIATLLVPQIAPLETLLLLVAQHIVTALAALPGARASIATPPVCVIVAYDTLAIVAAIALRRGRPLAAACAFSVACATVVAPQFIHGTHGLEITHLDVGQADAAVIRTPNGHVILIDTGGELERGGPTSNAERAGARIVLAYLRRTGIRAVDLMILTHPHGDHVGGCRPIIDAMPVRMIFDSGQQYSGRAFTDCMQAARTHAVPVVRVQRGMRWNTDDNVMLDILAPSLPTLVDTGDDINENSIVTRLTYDNGPRPLREMFMGDAGEASEARLLASGVDLRTDILKVGHHGSRYASTPAFVAAVRARIAVISVGRHNTFGHPAPATLTTMRASGTTIYRTDQCGAVTFKDFRKVSTMLTCDNY